MPRFFCHHCQTWQRTTGASCPACGVLLTDLFLRGPHSPDDLYYCPQCRHWDAGDKGFCRRCGGALLRPGELPPKTIRIEVRPLDDRPRNAILREYRKEKAKRRQDHETKRKEQPLEQLRTQGFCWLRGLLGAEDLGELGADLDAYRRRRLAGSAEARAGLRIALDGLPHLEKILAAKRCAEFLKLALASKPRLVRILLFEKSGEARWFVGWHRDETIPVKAHRPNRSMLPHSVKEGVPHVRATRGVLKRMLSLRFHLDATNADSGPLLVFPGSHLATDLDSPYPSSTEGSTVCLAQPGDVLAMRPLLLHSSPKPQAPARRRVLHLEFSANQRLPGGYEWHA
ncbi:MAG: phytanoyl-CoA dioxygenase family protein [Planctomycetota bacterium]|nr:phytanoyl-CoA dioxygenase family protein [Planctomycetota bacterium]